MSGRHHLSRRGVVLRIMAGGLVAAAMFVGGHEFAVWEGHAEPAVKVQTETVTEYQVPTACRAALADAVNGLELARRYDDEMRTLHKRDGGVHYFNPGDPGGHYETAQKHHRELSAAREAFDRARARCLPPGKSIGESIRESIGASASEVLR